LQNSKKGRAQFEDIINYMKNEDQENGFDTEIFIDTEEFIPEVMPSDVPGPDIH